MSNTRDTGFLRNAIQVTDQGVTFVSGSTTLMSISSSGAVTTTGVISGSNALSASFSLNSALLNGIGSVGFATTGALLEVSSSQQQISSSLLQVSASYISFSGSYNTFSGSASTRITKIENNYATTGSNSFRADQSITGSLVVSSTITAQTLVVQTVTSSIVYSSGSNLFGSALGDRQTFTGSLQVTGSMSVTGSAAFSSDVILPYSKALAFNSISNQYITADSSNLYLGAANLARLTISSSGLVGIGATDPVKTLDVRGTLAISNNASSYWYMDRSDDDGRFKILTDGNSEKFSISSSGNVGIGAAPNANYRTFIQASTTTSSSFGLYIEAGTNSSDTALAINSSAGSSTLLVVKGNGNVGIGTGTTYSTLTVGSGDSTAVISPGGTNTHLTLASLGAAGTIRFYTIGGGTGVLATTESMRIAVGGNVGIGTTTPTTSLTVRPINGSTNAFSILDPVGTAQRIAQISFSNATNAGELSLDSNGTTYVRISANRDSYITGGNLGIGTSSTLATLSTIGGAVQFMGDYRNYQTIIKNAGGNGTFNGSLLITIPQMSDGNTDGYGGYSCEVYVAGYSGFYCHAWFSGYINGGITSSEATILRSNGGWSISQVSYGANHQGFQFTIDYPSSIVHPTARIIFNKGGSPNSAAYPANTITSAFS